MAEATPKCQYCKDVGWVSWWKPLTGSDGKMHMVGVPQLCGCEAGQAIFDQNIDGAVQAVLEK